MSDSPEENKPKTYEELEKEVTDLKEFFEGLTPIKMPFRIPGVDKNMHLECLVSIKAAEQIQQITDSLKKKTDDDNKENQDNSIES